MCQHSNVKNVPAGAQQNERFDQLATENDADICGEVLQDNHRCNISLQTVHFTTDTLFGRSQVRLLRRCQHSQLKNVFAGAQQNQRSDQLHNLPLDVHVSRMSAMMWDRVLYAWDVTIPCIQHSNAVISSITNYIGYHMLHYKIPEQRYTLGSSGDLSSHCQRCSANVFSTT